jgi:IPT/TIG domain
MFTRYVIVLGAILGVHANAAVPVVTSLLPNDGLANAFTQIDISGTNFTGATAVNFGAAPATSFTVSTDELIMAVVPFASAGIVDVTVTNTDGTSATSPSDQYTYVLAAPAVTGVSPTSGATPGGTTVTLIGTSFTGATSVNFGAIAVTSFTVVSDTSITATSPPGTAGTVDITVTTPGGTSVTSAADQFTYAATPVVLQSFGVD